MLWVRGTLNACTDGFNVIDGRKGTAIEVVPWHGVAEATELFGEIANRAFCAGTTADPEGIGV